MNLLMISGDRSILQGKKGAFWYTLQGMRRHWSRIDIICPHPGVQKHTVLDELSGSGKRRSLEYGGVYFHPSPWPNLYSQPAWIYKKGLELHKKIGIDRMTVHEYPPFYNGIGAGRLWRTIRVPYAVEIHHVVGHPVAADMQERIAYLLSKFYLKHDCRNAAAVRTVNRTVQKMLVSWGMEQSKVKIVSSFYLDTAMLRAAPMPPIAYDIAFCGRMVPNKGLGTLLKVAVGMPDLRIIVIGDGPERLKHEHFVKQNGLSGRVTFTGWMPDREGVVQAMKSSRMFVMNSSSEGGPRVLLEAMGAGLPVVSTRVGIAPDVVREGENGLLTDGSLQDLSSKIRYLLQNESQRIAMGKHATEVLDLYDGDFLISEYCRFLRDLQ